MQIIEIKGAAREANGKKALKQMRKDGFVPCIVYGGEKEITFSTDIKSFNSLLYTPNVYLVSLLIDGQAVKAVLKDVQYDPVTGVAIHADFLEVFEDKKVTMSIPVKLVGSSEGVKNGGKLQLEMRKLSVKALPAHLPDVLEIDITNLGLGKGIRVGELSYENVEILNAKNAVVVSVKLTRAARAAAEAAPAK